MNNTQKAKTSIFYGSAITLITSGVKATLTNEALFSIVSTSAIVITTTSLAIYLCLYCADLDFSSILENK